MRDNTQRACSECGKTLQPREMSLAENNLCAACGYAMHAEAMVEQAQREIAAIAFAASLRPADAWRGYDPYSHKIALLWRNCRRSAGMSLNDVAGITPYTVSYLSDFERGRITPPLDDMAAMFYAVGYALQISAVPRDEEKRG